MQTAAMKKYRASHEYCECCAQFKNRINNQSLELHHINGRGIGMDEAENFVMLCSECHRDVHQNWPIYRAAFMWYKDPMNHCPDVMIDTPLRVVPQKMNRGKHGIFRSPEYNRFKDNFAMYGLKYGVKELKCTSMIRLSYSAPSWAGFDCDNCTKGPVDAIYKSDNRITRMDTRKVIDKENPFTRMEIWKE